jgi:hypothetical protein
VRSRGANFTAAYAWGHDLIRRNTEYPMFDGQGNERTITNSSETTTGTLLLDAFGNTVAAAPTFIMQVAGTATKGTPGWST